MRVGYMESLAEIKYRVTREAPKARPKVYHGIHFRSHLELRFAIHLTERREQWAYEPRIYGPRGRRYLPDFEILGGTRPTFIECKPTVAQAIRARWKMSVIWETHPNAVLITAAAEGCTFSACLQGSRWFTWQERWA